MTTKKQNQKVSGLASHPVPVTCIYPAKRPPGLTVPISEVNSKQHPFTMRAEQGILGERRRASLEANYLAICL